MFTNKNKKLYRTNKGSVLAEAALIIPVFIGIVLVVIEFGNVLYLTNSLNQVARSMTRYAAVTSTYTQQDLLDASGANGLLPDSSKITLTITPAIGSAKTVGTTITVNLSYDYTPIVNPFLIFNSNNSWPPDIESTSVARAEVSSG